MTAVAGQKSKVKLIFGIRRSPAVKNKKPRVFLENFKTRRLNHRPFVRLKSNRTAYDVINIGVYCFFFFFWASPGL